MKKELNNDNEYSLPFPPNAADLAESVKQYQRKTETANSSRITLADIKAGFHKRTGQAFTPEEAVAVAAAKRQIGEYLSLLRSGFTVISNQLSVTARQVTDALNKAHEPMRLLLVVVDFYEALKADDQVTIARIMALPDFGVHLLQLLVRWTEMNEEERAKVLEQELQEAKSFKNKVKTGSQKRQDQIDKKILIAYFKEKNHVIRNASELEQWPFNDWPLTRNYAIDTLKKQYKEAMPHVKLIGGRPKKVK